MLARLRQLLDAVPAAPPDTVGAPWQRRQLAVAALLLELAQIDHSISVAESATIERRVQQRFGLPAQAAADLIRAARVELDAALDDWIFAKAVREGFDAEERAAVVALLWEVVYADGRMQRIEAALVERLARALDVGERQCETARAQAFARAGLAGGEE